MTEPFNDPGYAERKGREFSPCLDEQVHLRLAA